MGLHPPSPLRWADAWKASQRCDALLHRLQVPAHKRATQCVHLLEQPVGPLCGLSDEPLHDPVLICRAPVDGGKYACDGILMGAARLPSIWCTTLGLRLMTQVLWRIR